jgi:hypothetical protein
MRAVDTLVAADLREVADEPVMYLRFEVDDKVDVTSPASPPMSPRCWPQ